MPDIEYTGTLQSAGDIAHALSAAGYIVEQFTPNDPKSVTELWVDGRKRFRPQALTAGAPRDFRAIVRREAAGGDGAGRTFLHVRRGARLITAEGEKLRVAQPTVAMRKPGVSTWRDQRTGQMTELFRWDGTEAGFSDLLNFFQLNGCQLDALRPAPGRGGVPALECQAKVLENGYGYKLRFDRESVFRVEGPGTVVAASAEDVRDGLCVESRYEFDQEFNNTEFAQAVFRDGLLLAEPGGDDEELGKKPWYKRWWIWLLVVLLPLAALFGIGVTGTDEEPEEEETAEVTPEPEPEGPAEDSGIDGIDIDWEFLDRIREWAFFEWIREQIRDIDIPQPEQPQPEEPAPEPEPEPEPSTEPEQ